MFDVGMGTRLSIISFPQPFQPEQLDDVTEMHFFYDPERIKSKHS